MIWFSAPPISSIISANSPARPVGSAGFACLSESAVMSARARLLAGVAGRTLMDEVALTTRVLMEAIADLKDFPALFFSAFVGVCPFRPAAVESR